MTHSWLQCLPLVHFSGSQAAEHRWSSLLRLGEQGRRLELLDALVRICRCSDGVQVRCACQLQASLLVRAVPFQSLVRPGRQRAGPPARLRRPLLCWRSLLAIMLQDLHGSRPYKTWQKPGA